MRPVQSAPWPLRVHDVTILFIFVKEMSKYIKISSKYMLICLHVNVCIFMCVWMSVCECLYVNVWTCMYICICVCVCICVRMHVCIHVCACMYTCMYVCMCVHVRMYVCMYACVYVCLYALYEQVDSYTNNRSRVTTSMNKIVINCQQSTYKSLGMKVKN